MVSCRDAYLHVLTYLLRFLCYASITLFVTSSARGGACMRRNGNSVKALRVSGPCDTACTVQYILSSRPFVCTAMYHAQPQRHFDQSNCQ